MIRGVMLVVDVVLGVVGGVLCSMPVVIVVAIFHIATDDQADWIVAAGAVLGAVVGVFKWLGDGPRPPSTVHGSAVFGAEAHARAELGGDEGLIVGRAQAGWLMRYDGPAHLVTLAPTRSGKGVGAIIPNLLTTERSVICIDPKGENARIAARARGAFGPVHVLDPFGVSGQPSAAFNPLDVLDPNGVDVAEDAAMIAEALVHDPPHQAGDAHWNEEAKALIAGVILHVAATAHGAATLAQVRDTLTRAPKDFQAELTAMQKSRAVGGLVARAANRHLGKSDREAAGVLSSAQRHTHFLDSPRMTAVLGRSDFSFTDLKRTPATVFLVLPPERLATHARWLRLLTAQAINALGRPRSPGEDVPVLLLLDEFAALGRLEPIERAFGLMAGYGLQLWAILQDQHQLKGLYGDKAGSFLANAGVVQVFNVADIDTATWVSRMLGTMTAAYDATSVSESYSTSQLTGTHGTSTSPHFVPRALMTPDEILRMSTDRLLLLRPGRAPLVSQKVRYFADKEFQGLYDA